MKEDIFSGAVALVTGAGSGIGRAAAILFAQHGARVACTDVSEDAVNETAELIRSAGGEAFVMVRDLVELGAPQNIVGETVAHFGSLNHAFNNAGIVGTHLDPWNEESVHKVLAINLEAVIWCMKHEIAHMLPNGGGTIVNTSSIAGLSGSVGSIDYAVAKHGVVGLTKTTAWKYGAQGIRVNAVCPGVVLSGTSKAAESEATEREYARLSPITRQLGDSVDVAEAVVWLSSAKSRFVHGVALPVDGGFMI